MEPILSAPCTPAQRQRDVLLGALVGLARSTVNEPKTEDTDHVLAAGLRQAANADAAEEALARMTRIVETEKHRVAPNCATCTMRCGNTDNYDLARLWTAPENIRALKLRMLRCVFQLAQGRPDAAALFFSPVSALIFSRKGVISAKMSLPGRFFAKLDRIFEKTLYK